MDDARTNDLALQRSLADVVAEYDAKRARIAAAIADFEQAGNDLKMAATIGGTFGDVSINVGHVYESELQNGLLRSAWKHVYDGLQIDRLASPTDKQRWKQALEKPAPFTLDNVRGTFGKFVADPRGNVLRALAEVFCGLDPAFKSHDVVKIGVKGLPKRIIMSGFGRYSTYGKDKLESVLNALAAYQGKPLVTWQELMPLLEGEEDYLLTARALPEHPTWKDQTHTTPGRGVRLRTFSNGNGHLFFESDTLRDVNMALAEFYGDVLPDTPEENPQKQQSCAVSKDLQYYPTPAKVVEDVLGHLYGLDGAKVLEPSCGCGRFMDGLRKRGAYVYGVEIDPVRAAQCRGRGHSVYLGNFLETVPTGDFDLVVMNPPFYGKHYAKHVRHAYEFLKPGGTLTAILPVTAREHGLLDDLAPSSKWDRDLGWRDLPVGSFAESGTNINTVVLTLTKRETSASSTSTTRFETGEESK